MPSLVLTIPTGYSYAAVILLFGAIAHSVCLPIDYRRQHEICGLVKIVIFSFLLYAMFWIGDAAIRGDGPSDFDRPSRFIIAAFCLTVFTRTQINAKWLWMGLGFGTIGAGGVAVWQWLIDGVSRASGFAPTNKFGLIAITMTLMCVSGLIWASASFHSKRLKISISFLLIAGMFSGLIAAMLSGSRGAWLALLPSTFIYLLLVLRMLNTKQIFLTSGGLVIFAAFLFYILPVGNITDRLNTVGTQLNSYIEGDFSGGSVGYRLEMWKGASFLFIERPFIGWGELGYSLKMEELEDKEVLQQGTASYTHAHNDWFNTLAKKGITGAFILLAVYLTPGLFFTQRAVRAAKGDTFDTSTFALAIAGIVFILSFMSGGIAQVTFNRNIGVMFYGFMVAALVGILANGASATEKAICKNAEGTR